MPTDRVLGQSDRRQSGPAVSDALFRDQPVGSSALMGGKEKMA